jgi:hypothetical protein
MKEKKFVTVVYRYSYNMKRQIKCSQKKTKGHRKKLERTSREIVDGPVDFSKKHMVEIIVVPLSGPDSGRLKLVPDVLQFLSNLVMNESLSSITIGENYKKEKRLELITPFEIRTHPYTVYSSQPASHSYPQALDSPQRAYRSAH